MSAPHNCAPAGCATLPPEYQDELRGWSVTVPKSSGARVLFGRYVERHDAEAVAGRLRAVGCMATVSRDPGGTP